MPRPQHYPNRPAPRGGDHPPDVMLPSGVQANKTPPPPAPFDVQQVAQLSERQKNQRLMITTAQRSAALKAARAYYHGHHDVPAVALIVSAIRDVFIIEGEPL